MTPRSWPIALAGLYGAAGVALHAAAAHGAGEALASAATMLLGHAPALVALALALDAGRLAPRAGRIAIAGLALGVLIFAGAVALHQLAGLQPVPMAAPFGGSMIILSWILVAVAALAAPSHSR